MRIIGGMLLAVLVSAPATAADSSIKRKMHIGMANGLLMQGKSQEAMDMLLKIRKSVKNPAQQARVDLQIAKAYLYLSDFPSAVRFYKTGLNQLTREGYEKNRGPYDTLPYHNYVVNWGYQKLGYCYLKLGKLNAARKALSRGLSLLQSVEGDPRTNNAYALATLYNNLTEVEKLAGRPEEMRKAATKWYDVTKWMARAANAKQRKWAGREPTIYYMQSQALDALGKLPEALTAIDQSISLGPRRFGSKLDAGKPRVSTQVEVFWHLHKATLLRRLGRPQDALKTSQVALQMATDKRPLNGRFGVQGNLKQWLIPTAAFVVGDLHAVLGDKQAAERAFRQSVQAVEKLYKSANSTQLRSRIADRPGVLGVEPAYMRLAELLADQGKWSDAFAVSEQGRGRALVDSVGNRLQRESGVAALSSADIDEERRILAKMKQLERMMMVARFNPNMDKRSLRGKIRKAQDEYSAFQSRLSLRHPGYAVWKNVDTLDTPGVQQTIAGRADISRSAVLVYVQAGRSLLGFCFTRGKFAGRILSRDDKQIRELVTELRQLIVNRNSNWQSPAQQLGDLLIQPFAAQLKNADKLIIVPHRILHEIPFATLQTGQSECLVKRHRLCVLPSVSLLRVWSKSTGSTIPWKSQQVLAVVNPDGSLPHAANEATTLQRLFKNVKTLSGSEAQERQVWALAGSHQILHFATHGVIDPLRPRYSHLLLAKSPTSTFHDGLLDAHEVARKLDAGKAKLVVLSACNTHVGPSTRGDEVQSLANAFLYAGAREVLASLWAVNDRSTAEWMDRFYSSLTTGATPAQALQSAMSAAHDKKVHPYYWSGFRLIGDH